MVYRVIGVVSGSSLNGLDLAFAELQESSGKWSAEVIAAERFPYTSEWREKLRKAADLPLKNFQQLDIAYGQFVGSTIREFIDKHQLHFKVQLIACHGHTVLYDPTRQTCSVLGDGASIAASTGINVVNDVRKIDMALGGKGAPVYPIIDKLLFKEYNSFLHLGANAQLSIHYNTTYQSVDVCPANRLLDLIAKRDNKPFDPGGMMAAEGKPDERLLSMLNELEYYHMPRPKTLSLDFASDVVYPLIDELSHNVHDSLRNAVEHIAFQVAQAWRELVAPYPVPSRSLMLTGGGANNEFLVSRIAALLDGDAEIIVPDKNIVNYKEPLAMAIMGILRWREENNVFSYITGASRDSIGGSVWIGQEA
jgi:anhydro-N-acetylmuramic acid kinase